MGVLGTLLAVPNWLVFHGTWILASLFRPFLLGTALCLMANIPAAHEKIRLFLTTFEFLAFCKDKKWKKPSEDPASFFSEEGLRPKDSVGASAAPDTDANADPGVERKTVVFLRHGESTWNDTFNKGDRSTVKFLLGFLPGLLRATFLEWYFLVSGQSRESWFFDSPLSEKGIAQAESVQKYLRQTDAQYATPKEARIIRIMTGESDEKSRLLCSNLRRAMSTVAIGLQDRLDRNIKGDTILILTELQEVSFNPDALSISPPKHTPVASWIDSQRVKNVYASQMDTSRNNGNKSIHSNGLERMQSFTQLLFEQIDAPNVVVTGHSFWFRAFFQTYLPHTFEHVCKKKKICNGGIAGFTMLRKKTDQGYRYMIDPASIVVLYGGF